MDLIVSKIFCMTEMSLHKLLKTSWFETLSIRTDISNKECPDVTLIALVLNEEVIINKYMAKFKMDYQQKM